MKKIISIALLITLATLLTIKGSHLKLITNVRGTPTRFNSKVVYGHDDRKDFYLSGEHQKRLADSTVALFNTANVESLDGIAHLITTSYGEDYRLCTDEPFRDQSSGAFCSGSLVGPDLIMTAGHCVRSESLCKKTKFVFGFTIKNESYDPTTLSINEVYGCSQIISRKELADGADYALIKLDRVVDNHKPLLLNRQGSIIKGTPLFVIGHPAGLPTKIAAGAAVRDSEKDGFFVANLDTYGGNSGSAVFNAETGYIEGILVRGETDYVWDDVNKCQRTNILPDDGGRGEDVTKIEELAPLIPKNTLQLPKFFKRFLDSRQVEWN